MLYHSNAKGCDVTTAKILLVEDDPEQVRLFSQVLELSGYQVASVHSAEEARARLTAEPFALLLADWDLGGGMQGDELIRGTKAEHVGIKAMLFSNHPQVNEVAAACGADAAFRKIEGIVKLRQLVKELAPLGAHA